MTMWCLINKNGRIFRQHPDKYKLLKWEVETKEPVTKKTIKQFKEGDAVVVVFTKRFLKWFRAKNGHLYQDEVCEVNESTYFLHKLAFPEPPTRTKENKKTV